MKKFIKLCVSTILCATFITNIVSADNSQQVLNTLNNTSYLNSLIGQEWGGISKFAVADMNNDGNMELILTRDYIVYSSAIYNVCVLTFKNGSPIKVATEHMYHGYNPSTGIFITSSGWTGSITYDINKINSDGSVSNIHTINAEYNTSIGNCYRIDGGSYKYFSNEQQLSTAVDSLLSYYNLQQPTFYDYFPSNFSKAIIAAGGSLSGGSSSGTKSYNFSSNNYSVTNKVVAVYVGKQDVFVGESADNGKFYSFKDATPYIQVQSSSVMVPLGGLSIALTNEFPNINENEIVSWNSRTKTAGITIGNINVQLTAGDKYMYVNGRKEYMGGAVAEIVNGRIYLPFRAIGQAFGVNASWDADYRMAQYN